jgi:hypothetical protein
MHSFTHYQLPRSSDGTEGGEQKGQDRSSIRKHDERVCCMALVLVVLLAQGYVRLKSYLIQLSRSAFDSTFTYTSFIMVLIRKAQSSSSSGSTEMLKKARTHEHDISVCALCAT